MNRLPLIFAAALALAGCASEDEAQLLVPAQLEFSWNPVYNQPADGRVAVLPFDVMVYDSESGEPLAGVEIELAAEVPPVGLLPAEVVQSATQDCTDCAWDAYRDAPIVLPESEVSQSLVVRTDDDGLARVHAVVDVLPEEDGGFAEAAIVVASGSQSEIVRLLPW
jgi:hypothetical protein